MVIIQPSCERRMSTRICRAGCLCKRPAWRRVLGTEMRCRHRFWRLRAKMFTCRQRPHELHSRSLSYGSRQACRVGTQIRRFQYGHVLTWLRTPASYKLLPMLISALHSSL